MLPIQIGHILTSRPIIVLFRVNIRSGPKLKNFTLSSLSTNVRSIGRVLNNASNSDRKHSYIASDNCSVSGKYTIGSQAEEFHFVILVNKCEINRKGSE